MAKQNDMRGSHDPVTAAEENVQKVQDRLKVLQAASVPDDPSVDWCRQDEIIGLLASVTESMVSACRQRSTEYTTIVERMSTIEANVKDIREDIAALCRIVRDGNGQPSMIQRLANLEVIVSTQQADIAKVEKHANAIVAAKALSKSQVVAGLIGMVVTALLSSLALAATLMK
jgi:hypothetical protein